MIEYGIDQNYSGTGNDFVFMTSLLHEKIDSHSITFSNIEPLYQGYIGAAHFDGSINMNAPVLNELYAICDSITTVDTNLENKIILAIGIRHKAEEFMLSEIASYANPLQWLDRR